MLERLNIILNSIIGSFIGVFIGHSIYRFIDYRNNPGVYAMQSATWYSSIQVYGLTLVLVVAIAIIIKFLVKKKMRSI